MAVDAPYGGRRLLADTSAWCWAKSLPPVLHAEWTAALSGNRVWTCVPVVHELGQGVFTARDLDALYERHRALHYQGIGDKEMRAALSVMAKVSRLQPRTAYHRGISLTDALVAVTAERHELTVLHYDSDFARLGEALDAFEHLWIAPETSLTALPTSRA
jgi:predicted nucleic acid-binding protein